jgi:NAD(P)-dependent dehydrogenase (short-subunit alcohol dehydrogenase family)
MAHEYAEKVVVVTGASAGIGAALARELARRGARLVLVARRREQLDEVARGLPAAEVVVGDVTRREDHARALDAAVARFGRVDVWVNNAGRGITRPLLALGDADLDEVFRDNVRSALYGMQVALGHMKPRGTGVVVNVSSMLSRVPFAPIRSAYSAAKAALNSLTETARFELAKDFPGIRLVTVLPGVVATDFGLNALGGGPDSRALPGAQDVGEVARVMADGMLAGPADLYTRPDGLDAVLAHLRRLGGGERPARGDPGGVGSPGE